MTYEALHQAMVDALKARQSERKEIISLLVAAVKKKAVDEGCRDNIPEEMVDSTILKEMKSTQEQIDTCPASRGDLLEQYKAKMAVIEEFAPKQLSAEDIEAIIKEKFAEVIATKNKGLIMKSVMGELKGKADGKLINQVVAKLMQ